MSQRLGRLKEQVQDLHRDVTLQRGASYSSRAEAALREGLLLEDQLNRRQGEMERIKKLFESTWNEHMRQVRIEQEVFQTQVTKYISYLFKKIWNLHEAPGYQIENLTPFLFIISQ